MGSKYRKDEMPESARVRALLRAHEQRSAREDATPDHVKAFVRSDIGQRIRAGQMNVNGAVEIFATSHETAEFIRSRSYADDMTALQLEPDAPRQIQTRPLPAPLLGLVTIIPVDTPNIPVVPQSMQAIWSGYVPDAASPPSAGPDVGAWSVSHLEAARVVSTVDPVPLELLTDAGQVQDVLDLLVTGAWSQAVQAAIVNGTSPTALEGIASNVDVPVITKAGGEFAADGLADGIELVEDAGFGLGPHVAMASSATWKAIRKQRDTTDNYLRRREVLPTVALELTVPNFPDGEAIVGAPSEVLLYLYGSFNVQVSQGVSDYFARGLAYVLAEQRAAIWVRNPTAFAIVNGL
jgi:HK97 family phage major capsid protein